MRMGVDWTTTAAVLDPALSQAIATLAGALAMLIISMASYYFPKDRSRFDDDDDEGTDDHHTKHCHSD